MSVYVSLSLSVCLFSVCMCVYVCVCMYVCVYIYVCMYVCVCVCVCVCVLKEMQDVRNKTKVANTKGSKIFANLTCTLFCNTVIIFRTNFQFDQHYNNDL